MPKDPIIAIRDCLTEIAILQEIARRMTLQGFRNDPIARRAAAYAVQTISEAVRRIPDEWLADFAAQPWAQIKGIGNVERTAARTVLLLLWLSCGLAGCAPRSVVGLLRGVQRRASRGRLLVVEGTMYRIWYWAMIDRESDGRVVASVPDLNDVAVTASTEKDALAHLTVLAAERVRAAVEGGQPVPGRRHFTELPSRFPTKEIGRAIIPVEVERTAAWPAPPFEMSP